MFGWTEKISCGSGVSTERSVHKPAAVGWGEGATVHGSVGAVQSIGLPAEEFFLPAGGSHALSGSTDVHAAQLVALLQSASRIFIWLQAFSWSHDLDRYWNNFT